MPGSQGKTPGVEDRCAMDCRTKIVKITHSEGLCAWGMCGVGAVNALTAGCKDALAYLHKVKTTVAHQPEVYDEFLSRVVSG